MADNDEMNEAMQAKLDEITDYIMERLREFMKEFEAESDSACVILSSSMLEEALGDMIKANLVPTSSAKDNLLDEVFAPISSFSARIDFAHRIGLISVNLCHDLHLIRRIRNEFAHNTPGCNFSNPSTRDRVNELVRSIRVIDHMPSLRQQLSGVSIDTRMNFLITVTSILGYLWGYSHTILSIKPAAPEKLIYG